MKFIIIVLIMICKTNSILYPQTSKTREVKLLDGLWDFALTEKDLKVKNPNTIGDFQLNRMVVPSSYNDITVNWTVTDHVGLVWYETKFFVPKYWEKSRVWIRFSSVCYSADVHVNSKYVTAHEIGHLPFEKEVTENLHFGQENVLTVVVNNILHMYTIPQGLLELLPNMRVKQTYTFDYFNYAGIDRSVFLYTTPLSYIVDINITTDIKGNNTGIITYNITVVSSEATYEIISIIDQNKVIEKRIRSNPNGTIRVKNCSLWWPYLMHPKPGHQYIFQVKLLSRKDGTLLDVYRQKFGIRKLQWTNSSFLINNRTVYLRGFGKHEDFQIKGKGLDLPVILRDYNLIKWIGGNSFRTTHYPYSEEIMDIADEMGIMVINECPSVNAELFSAPLLENHKQSLTELIQRDKNRPSVIMWSAANEPATQYDTSSDYFKEIISHIKTLDSTRPVTMAIAQTVQNDHAAKYLDIISVNRYDGWYESTGDLDMITNQLVEEIKSWHKTHNKPVLITEYGADTLSGFHSLPSYIWSEEFQDQLFEQHFDAFDILRNNSFFIGEMVWNFAEFATAPSINRAGGNRKGIFTRSRQPKSSAHLIRKRYLKLAKEVDNHIIKCSKNKLK